MKKNLILLPLLTLMLSACSGLNFPSNNQNSQETPLKEPSSRNIVDAAVKVLNLVTIFVDEGAAIDLNEYIELDDTANYVISDYSFTSSNPDVIEINGYSATCKSQGYAEIKVAGPGINYETSISFYVGSIAGKYVPDSRSLANVASITIGEMDPATRISPVDIKVNEATVGKKTYTAYEATGSYVNTGLPLLIVDFDANTPKDFAPLTDFLSLLGLGDVSDLGDLGANVYGLLSADEDLGVCIKTMFNGSIVDFYQE